MAQLDTGITVYDINKQGMQIFDPLDRIALGVKVSNMAKDIFSREGSLSYWMLLSNENKDYTVFHFNNRDNKALFQKEFIETILLRGDVTEIEAREDGNYEVWIRERDTQDNKLYLFFNYTFGVIEI